MATLAATLRTKQPVIKVLPGYSVCVGYYWFRRVTFSLIPFTRIPFLIEETGYDDYDPHPVIQPFFFLLFFWNRLDKILNQY